MKNDLVRLIQKSDYVSFDIFDTALLRRVVTPTDLFFVVESRYNRNYKCLSFEFAKRRVEAEADARNIAWRERQAEEVTLTEIYGLLQRRFDVDQPTLNLLKDVELQTETGMCMANPYMYSVYQFCLRKGKRVVFNSDIYLPLPTVREMLVKSGYTNFERLYLSSDTGMTKATGKSYKLMIDTLGCKPDRILHIGDNAQSDVAKAREYGITAFHYRKCLDEALNRPNFAREGFAEINDDAHSIHQSLYLSAIINKYYPSRQQATGRNINDFWHSFGFKYAGLLYYGFIDWLIRRSREDKIEKLYFLSRDGFVMKQVYDFLAPFYTGAPSSDYLYVSRRSLHIPMADDSNKAEVFSYMQSGMYYLPVKYFFEKVGLKAGAYEKQLREAGFKTNDDRLTSDAEYKKLFNLLNAIFDDIQRIGQAEKPFLLKYLKNSGLFDQPNVAVVDIGWHCSLQRALMLLSSRMGWRTDIRGYYLGTFAKARDVANQGMTLSGYLCDFGEPAYMKDIIMLAVEVFEFLHLAPHGCVVRFQDTKDGTVAPVFDEDCDSKKIGKAQRVRQGAMDFIQQYVTGHPQDGLVQIPPEFAIKPLHRVLSDPTYTEACQLGDLKHVDGHVGHGKHIARPPGLLQSLLNLGCEDELYYRCHWRIGYKARQSFQKTNNDARLKALLQRG
jgi:HAD superfamily hydrolase (TIGR01549 family)